MAQVYPVLGGPALRGRSDLLHAAEDPFLQKDQKANGPRLSGSRGHAARPPCPGRHMATAGPQAGWHSWPRPTARTALGTEASAHPWCSHPRAPACISGSYMPPDDTCGNQIHSRQKTLCQPYPAPLLAHGTEPSRVPQGPVCSTFTQMGLEPPELPQCRSSQPLEAGGWACKCGREAGKRVLLAQKWGHVKVFPQQERTHALPCSNRPTSKKGIYPTRTEQLLARGPAAEAAGHLVSHPSGQCACARVCTCREGHATVP